MIKKKIASEFNLPHRKFLESWIRSLTVLRNTIAHHARVWNRKYPYKPTLPKKLPDKWMNVEKIREEKLYSQLCVLAYLENAIHPHNTFAKGLKKLLAMYPNVDVAAMGFPKDWASQPLWSIAD